MLNIPAKVRPNANVKIERENNNQREMRSL